MKLTDMQVKEFINVLASDAPAPGGGSASALAGAMGVGLAKMVASLTLGKAKYAEHQETVQQIHDRANELVSQLTAGIDRDTEAFDGVSAVFAMPKNTDEEKAARKEAMAAASAEKAKRREATLKAEKAAADKKAAEAAAAAEAEEAEEAAE